MNSKPFTVVIVGFGEAGSKHYRVLRGCPAFTVVGLVDPDPIAEAPKGLPIFKNQGDALAALRPDVTVIATPPTVSVGLAPEAALQSRTVLVEKPVTTSWQQLSQAINDEASNRVFVAFQTHFSDQSLRLLGREELKLDTALRGTVGLSWSRDDSYFRDWRASEDSTGGLLAQHAIHGIALWLRLIPSTDTISDVRAAFLGRRSGRGEDVLHAQITFVSGRQLVIAASLVSAARQSHWLLVEPSDDRHEVALVYDKNLGQAASGSQDSDALRRRLYDAVEANLSAAHRHPSLFPLRALRQTFEVIREVASAIR